MYNGDKNLKALYKNDNILQAEIGALLHNLGKLSKAFFSYQRHRAKKRLNLPITDEDSKYKNFNYQAIVGIVADFITNPGVNIQKSEWNSIIATAEDWLDIETNRLLPEGIRDIFKQNTIKFPKPLNDRNYSFGDFIEFQAYKWYDHKNSKKRITIIFPNGSKATELLEMSHNAASGVEKEGAIPGSGFELQFKFSIFISSVFGYETPINEDDSEIARNKIIQALQSKKRSNILKTIMESFLLGVGDTQRPINDISLWDLSFATAAFFKAAIARTIIDITWMPRVLFEWRLLHIGFDGLAFLSQAPSIGDLLGRRAALQQALDEVQILLEEIYPLGNEVYRDENGSAFIMPALDGDDTAGSKLRNLIEGLILEKWQQSELKGELVPTIYLSAPNKQAIVLHEALDPRNNPPGLIRTYQESILRWWDNPGNISDVCTVCGVRPQGWSITDDQGKNMSKRHYVCGVCSQRREKRAEFWVKGRSSLGYERAYWERTIWLDEVADKNGRLALVVGKFGLQDWLNGEMVETLLAGCDPGRKYISKNPSFARISRVWRTTQKFWQTVQEQDIPQILRKTGNYRLSIKVQDHPAIKDILTKNRAYEIKIGEKLLPAVWDEANHSLLTAGNLLLWEDKGAKALLKELPEKTLIYEPGGYGRQRTELCVAVIDKEESELITDGYCPTIPLLARPSSFMTLVPAQSALNVVLKIYHRYELEMSKVRNRLPFFLGLVFFDRRQTLFSVLDAGRRLLNSTLGQQKCTVVNVKDYHNSSSDLPPYLANPHFCKCRRVDLTSERGQLITWYVSTVMGDGDTEDYWYPYINVVHDQYGNLPTRHLQFSLENGQEHWVHASNLEKGDLIKFAPSYFTWVYMDTSARRFEVDAKKEVMEELTRLTEIWVKLKKLAHKGGITESQLHGIVTLLATKREIWGKDSWQYRQLVKTIISKEKLDLLTEDDFLSGCVEKTFDLYHRILKCKLREEKK